jgi:hypothetical protein
MNDELGIYIPSYKRSETCTAHKFLTRGTYVVRKSEEELYKQKDLGSCDVLGVDDHLICGLVEVNQWLIDNAKEKVIVILDDDIKHFYYRMERNDEITDPEIVMMELERIAQILVDLDLGFAATDPTTTIWNYVSEFEFKGTAGAIRWVNRPCFKSRLNKELEYNYDLDVVLQELLHNRIIIKPKYFCSKGETDTNSGGASEKNRQDQYISIELMKKKWGRYFEFNYKNNKPRICVKR